MDKQLNYREILLDVLRKKEWDYGTEGAMLRARLIADKENDRYIMVVSGWRDRLHIHGVHFQLDIINGKIWFQVNNTEEEIVDELMAAGVPASDIVLGFIPEKARIATGFATA
ncbi:MAG: element excision factor XisI family protein [Bacteroidota bacterium]